MDTMVSEEKSSILLTFDVEDWFQVENFKAHIEFSTWNSFEPRVEKSTNVILDLLDSFPFKPKATFFTLGWIAKKFPHLVKEIRKRGHEIASHGVDHHLCTRLSVKELLRDLTDSRHLLEDLTGENVKGYRAPSFAIDDEILKIIHKAGYLYDSSYNSFSAHGRYGTIDLSGALKLKYGYQIKDNFFELPLSNLTLFNKVIPFGGGGYFRLMPFPVFRAGVKQILKQNKSFVFYSHPWEFDPDQPRVNQASPWFKFRHYVNLNKTGKKLKTLISTFAESQFLTCSDYLKNQCVNIKKA